jgi:hypothetical protein
MFSMSLWFNEASAERYILSTFRTEALILVNIHL